MKNGEGFSYLGSVMSNSGKFTKYIDTRRTGTTRDFGMLKRRLWGRWEVSFNVQMKTFNGVLRPVLLYGATAWAQTGTEDKRLDAFEMYRLRTIAGVRWDNFLWNQDIRERLWQPSFSLKVRKSRMKWFGHFQRIEEKIHVTRIVNTEMQVRKPLWSSRTRWKDLLQRDLEESRLILWETATEAPNCGR